MGDDAVKRIDVVLRDLDVILRKKIGNGLILDSFETSSLVPPGENYGSTMLRVDAVVRRHGADSEPEVLSLVAKMTPPTEFQKIMFDSPFTFRKEIYMFTDIVPAYIALERECGVPEDELFDPLPELYGARLSLDEAKDEFDYDAVILMENLKPKNYACGDRKIGVDMEHATSVIEALARFHGLGIAMKLKKPELFADVKSHAKSMEFKEDLMVGAKESIRSDLNKIPALVQHMPRIEKVLDYESTDLWLKPPAEPWGTIAHTDLWLNNVMIREDGDGCPTDVKFIDFQNYLYQNPMRDLVFFIFLSCKKEVYTSHVGDLTDLYYKTLTSHLGRLGCDLNSFSRESFNEQLSDAGLIEYIHCLMMARILLMDENDPCAANPELLLKSKSNPECLERISTISLRFIKENWI